MSFQAGVKIMSYSPLAGWPVFSHGWDQAKQEAYDAMVNKDRYWGHVYRSARVVAVEGGGVGASSGRVS